MKLNTKNGKTQHMDFCELFVSCGLKIKEHAAERILRFCKQSRSYHLLGIYVSYGYRTAIRFG